MRHGHHRGDVRFPAERLALLRRSRRREGRDRRRRGRGERCLDPHVYERHDESPQGSSPHPRRLHGLRDQYHRARRRDRSRNRPGVGAILPHCRNGADDDHDVVGPPSRGVAAVRGERVARDRRARARHPRHGRADHAQANHRSSRALEVRSRDAYQPLLRRRANAASGDSPGDRAVAEEDRVRERVRANRNHFHPDDPWSRGSPPRRDASGNRKKAPALDFHWEAASRRRISGRR